MINNSDLDRIGLLLDLRARVLYFANQVDSLSELKSIVQVRTYAPFLADQMRALVSEAKYVEGCKRHDATY
jgi:hypothetical protein